LKDKRTKKHRIFSQITAEKKNNPERWADEGSIRLGYCFHSNGFDKKQLSNSSIIGFLSMQKYGTFLLPSGQNNKKTMQFDHWMGI
jgi:hypothetical protein